jgi:hypothetical protein
MIADLKERRGSLFTSAGCAHSVRISRMVRQGRSSNDLGREQKTIAKLEPEITAWLGDLSER